MSFFTIAVLLTVASILVLIMPIIRPRPLRMDAENMNAAILQEQILELEHDLNEDSITHKQFETAKEDLQLDFANSAINKHEPNTTPVNKNKAIAIAFVTILVPILSFATYQKTKTKLETMPLINQQSVEEQPSIALAMANLEAKLAKNPDDIDGWIMLANSYGFVGNKDKAVGAYRQALKLEPEDSWVMTQLAHAVSEQNGSLAGEPLELIQKSLKISPNNMDARFLLGKYHFQNREFKKAIEHWEFLLGIVNAKDAVPVRKAINAARSQLGLMPLSKADAQNNYIEVTISLDPKFKDQAPEDATIFVYAKAKTGPKMPLAATKSQVAKLPVTIKLNDSMAMLPDLAISKFMPVNVSARVSLSGNAVSSAGDFIGTVEVDEPNQKVKLLINQQVQ